MNRLCVLIPVFNNQAGLDRTCASLAAAEGDFDVLVIDDGSTIPIRTPNGSPNRAIALHRFESNRGITCALNAGLSIAGKLGYNYIGRVDSSDTVNPSRFERQVRYLDANERCGIVGTYIQFVDMTGAALFVYRAPCSHSGISRKMRAENCLIHSGVVMRASVLAQVGGYRETCMTSEDYDLFLRMVRASEAAVLPLALTKCEYNLTGISVKRRRKQQRERLNLQMLYFAPFNWASYYGVARTCLAMLVPHGPVLQLKRAFFAAVC